MCLFEKGILCIDRYVLYVIYTCMWIEIYGRL